MNRRKPKPSYRRKRPPPADLEQAIALHVDGRLDEAESVYRRLIALDPRDARAHHLLGRLLHQQGDADAAFESLTSALVATPNDVNILNDLGMLHLDAERWDLAMLDAGCGTGSCGVILRKE